MERPRLNTPAVSQADMPDGGIEGTGTSEQGN